MQEFYSHQDIADYYDQTEVHYRRGWQLSKSMALHYGYWTPNTRTLADALRQMNVEMASLAAINENDTILDAGCGVGGSCVYLASQHSCHAYGISLSATQINRACANAQLHGVSERTNFSVQDYTKTSFHDATFDVAWALESSGSATNKIAFIKEMYRVLKPGGRLVIGDWYRTRDTYNPKEENILMIMLRGQAVSDICTLEELNTMMSSTGFTNIRTRNINTHIKRSSFYIFMGAISMFFIAHIYKLFNPKVRHFAHNHYKALFWQYPALRKNLWAYYLIYAEKPASSG